MEFDRRYKQLNDAQKRAVDCIEGPVLVIAGPGTGKTELLSIRIANILKKTDTLPENILCLTFTGSGASAMRERLVGIIGKEAYKVAIHTFHSFGTDIINRYREYFYNGALFSPADDVSRYTIIKDIFDSLEHSNPLASTMNGDYTHLQDAQRVISELKRAGGLTSDELLAVIQQDEDSLDEIGHLLLPLAEKRVGKGTATELSAVLPKLQAIADKTSPLYEVTPLVRIVAHSLQKALDDANEEESTKPISKWKSTWLGRNEEKALVFKDRTRLAKLKALSFVYYEYLRRMEHANLYDYDDMILQVVHAMEVYPDLRFGLQEQYLYIMVDEFQDTNVAQMRILHNLTDNPVHEGAPNILAVGDDDQAVYGFQGADVSNMLNFKDAYASLKLITLTENYRSVASILTTSRAVISQGTDRLESRLEGIDKQLHATREEEGVVELHELPDAASERQWIAETIARTREEKGSGPMPHIAVLGRQHQDIQNILPYLQHAGVPVRYEKQDNALEQPPIVALELLARTLLDLADGRHADANARMPELLAHPAWGIEPKDIWKLSLTCYESRQHWMQAMETMPVFTDIHAWLVKRVADVHNTTLEEILDTLMGQGDGDSPFFQYFFSPEVLQNTPEMYLDYLGALRSIRDALRDNSSDETASLRTFVAFIDTYRRLNLTITVPRLSRASTDDAVDLLTAHKSKGLEFDTVYVINATDSRWGHTARSRPRNISYPENLPLTLAGDTADERLRLFYVAMTRAKSRLVMSYTSRDDKERPSLRADFLVNTALKPQTTVLENITNEINATKTAWHEPLSQPTKELKEVLMPRLESYRLSATDLTSFLDVTRGGPRNFLLSNLLRFPRASSPAISYGNAVHRALQQAHVHLVATGEQRPVEDILHDFEAALRRERLSEANFKDALQKGSDHLPIFLASPRTSFTKTQKAE
ncbi:ATP-dependent helicase, partial [Candidatus Saccharibacteria bacterium]|nr:ATP-dependent helicase [Candidatus Saccharibacteria bacterium]